MSDFLKKKKKKALSKHQVLLPLRRSFDEFAFHLHTNTIGPIITAQKLLNSNIPIGTIVFMSSDSGSAGKFREMEDGQASPLPPGSVCVCERELTVTGLVLMPRPRQL